tara:strand:+ start:42 stop:980 length:939 start_codon:yes stop_codon:yes gene_type:complete
MATQTLAEARKLIQDDLVAGVAEDIFTTNPIYTSIPFTGYAGHAILVNRENVLGDAQHLAVGGTITAKAASSVEQFTFTSTTTIGDAEVNGLLSAQSTSGGVDLMANEVQSKAKSIARKLQAGIATGSGTGAELNSVHTLCATSQYTTASAGQDLSFELLDELLALVKSKDGEVDYMMAPQKIINKYRSLVRSLGGVTETIAFDMGNGRSRNVDVYNNIPLFVNDYLSVAETANGAALVGGDLASLYAGVWDDGTNKVGSAMIHPESVDMGLSVEVVGQLETKDEMLTRIKSYSNFASFNRKGLARLTSLNV